MKFRRVSTQYFIDNVEKFAANAGPLPFNADNIIDADTCPAGYIQCSDTDHATILRSMLYVVSGNWRAMEDRNAVLQTQLNELLTQDLI